MTEASPMGVLSFVVPWLALVLLACGVSATIAWLATRRAARQARATLEQRARDGDAVVLRGKLRVAGEGVDSDWGGSKKLAAVSPIRSRSRLWPRQAAIVDRGERCATLWLDAAGGSTRLEGPLGVEAGTRQRWKGAAELDRGGKWFAADYAIFNGDDVVVAGVRSSAPLSRTAAEGRYRDSATQATLSPLPDGAMALAAIRAIPSLSIWQLLRLPGVMMVALAAVIPSYSSAAEHAEAVEACTKGCRADGRCAVDFEGWSELRDSWWNALKGDVYRCAARDDTDCRQSSACVSGGSCSAVEGRCVAAIDDDCRFTTGCVQAGLCGARGGACVALRDADCRELWGCIDGGRCSAIDGSCNAGGDTDCAASYYCKQQGKCSPADAGCVAGKDEDCRQSELCASLGDCTARDGNCTLATSRDCRERFDCRVQGRCSFVEGAGCAVTSDADCLSSEDCALDTKCRAENGECVSDGPCRTSAACRVYGHCRGDHYCSPDDEDDCKQSEACKQHGACKLLAGECAASCAARDECKKDGLCSLVDLHSCSAHSDDDCRQSDVCRVSGRCTPAKGRCVARSNDDCRRSSQCRWEGRCTLVGDACVAAGDDCLATRNCHQIGYCQASEGRCTSGRANDYCRQSRLCKELGRCVWGTYECVVGTHPDCRQSEVCRRYGWCEKVLDACFVRE